jgi:hypothetical protein
MTKEEKNQLVPFFGLVYYMTTNNYPELTEEVTNNFIQKLESDENFNTEISQAAADETGKYDEFWKKAADLYNQQAAESKITSAKFGTKFNKIKLLQEFKKGGKSSKKKCKCGCELVSVKEKGGKMVEQCACNCGGGKVKMKAKGGVLELDDLSSLRDNGIVDPSITNKWERKLNAKKLGRFKK